jgi:hypothetical protein
MWSLTRGGRHTSVRSCCLRSRAAATRAGQTCCARDSTTAFDYGTYSAGVYHCGLTSNADPSERVVVNPDLDLATGFFSPLPVAN